MRDEVVELVEFVEEVEEGTDAQHDEDRTGGDGLEDPAGAQEGVAE